MKNYELVEHEGLDGLIWYVIFRLENGKRVDEILRTTNRPKFFMKIDELFLNKG